MAEMMYQPKQTKFDGHIFRSRLEAKWAVFFKAAGIRYEYEPMRFDVGNGVSYLPDFFLPDVGLVGEQKGLWIEVKYKMSDADAMKVVGFSKQNPILCVGQLPNARKADWRNYPMPDDHRELFWTWRLIDGIDEKCEFYKEEDGTIWVNGPVDKAKGYEAMRAAFIMAWDWRFEEEEQKPEEPNHGHDDAPPEEPKGKSRKMEKPTRVCIVMEKEAWEDYKTFAECSGKNASELLKAIVDNTISQNRDLIKRYRAGKMALLASIGRNGVQ